MQYRVYSCIAASSLGVFITANPVEYDAPDGVAVDVFFVTVGPPSERNTHLELLGQISKLVLETDLLARLRAAQSDDEIAHVLRECEERSLAKSTRGRG